MPSLRVLADVLRRRALGAEETVAAALSRCGEAKQCVFAAILADEAVRDAREADRRSPPLPPLHGVPFSVKEQIAVAGVATREASLLLPPEIPRADADVVALLRAAGAVLVATTNMSELALFPDSVNRVYGATVNPHDPTRSAGGSSGGEAAAVALGLVPFGIGSDYGGSLRCPAHFCGVAGLRPGPGVVPADGAGGRVRVPARSLLSTVGPLARSADDLAVVLDALVPALPAVAAPTHAAVMLDGMGPPIDARCRAAVQAAAAALAGLGLSVDEELPPCHHVAEQLFDEVTAIETHLALAPLVPGREAEASPQLLAVWDAVAGLRPGVAEHDAVLARIPRLQAEARAWLGAGRVLLAPPAATPAFELGRLEGVFDLFAHCKLASIAGLPALVVPVPLPGPGLPVGVQLVGAPGSERALVELGRRLERALAA